MGAEYIEISTTQGKLKGLINKSFGISKKTYYSFQGIPYAKPPIGELRFKGPEPYDQWEGVRDATKEGNHTLQKHMFFKNQIGDEDCLYLNVFTTQAWEGHKKAVMVWIHGGGFTSGSSSSELYGPDFLVEQDIVLVTINYRCGVLGFLSLENEKVPGNAGLKDQTQALRWVQQHIQSFGGDPDNVTIFGESAGGASVHYHLLSPLSKGLFHKAILQSGTALCQWAFQSKPKEKALLLARELGCTSQDPETVLEFLRSVPAADLLQTQHKESLSTVKEKIHTFSFVFLPCIEKAGDAPFLLDNPRKLMERGEFSDVPIIIGVTEKEGMLALTMEVNWNLVNSNLSLMVPNNLNISQTNEEECKLGKEILQFYTNKEMLSWDVVQGYVDFITDVEFAFEMESSRQSFLKHKATPVYVYLFTYTSPRAFSSFLVPMAHPDKAAEVVGSGASHGDDLAHQFKTNMSQVPFIPPSPEDVSFMNIFLKAWTNFAKNGNPNCEELRDPWQPDSLKTPHFLDLGKVCKTVTGTIFPKRMEFWKKVYERYSYSY